MFDLGDTVPLGLEVRDAADALTTPAAIVLAITQPDGTTAAGTTPATATTGIYTYAFVPTQAGRHSVRWTTTGPATAYTDMFDVSEAAPPLIVGLAEAKAYLNIEDDDGDEELRAFIEGVTEVVENGDGNDFRGVGPVVRRTVTATIYPNGSCVASLPYTEVLSLTSAVDVGTGVTVSLTGYTFDQGVLRPAYGADLPLRPWTITYVVGRPSLPANIRLGALEILKLAWNSQRGNGEPPAFLVPYRAQAWLGGYELGPSIA